MANFSGGAARGQAVELREQREDQGGNAAKELPIVTEENAQSLWNGEDQLPMRKLQEEPLVEVFGEKEGAFLRTGRAEGEPFTGKGTEVFDSAFGAPAAPSAPGGVARLPPKGLVH